MNTTPTPSDLDLYINDIVDKLRAKYNYVDKDYLNSSVRFCYVYETITSFSPNFIELTYTELTESMNKNELPKDIQKLL